ncbi:unnamed protein product [Rotaria magnacalcarata]|uniref:Uncharacterized protein n=1 Tax=Rotaria magnacalcarata TaxID=392030 RepID=A0A816NJJ0_9BILA|nr:unnamed protein product [Rotaria magnacalcarata]CAF2035423.1 unnamed protein product [Rotaria magnacalcarata]CAF3990474.1 unnamed protein product [Rotaria magnacalcarata]CAF4001795.1 unnamed protein product [Rotaria magnacalcarata]
MAGNSFTHAVPVSVDGRDFGHFSDHITVWIDQYIGVQNTYANLKTKFNNNIQVLQSNNEAEAEIDDDTMICANPDMLKELAEEVYCLKYFSTVEDGLDYINNHPEKKIFFISSGTIGKIIVPEIANLPQIQGIYIFCGNISHQVIWAGDYVDKITAMFEHQDNLLERLTQDIAKYVESKGDQYKTDGDNVEARNCYSWSKKLLVRRKMLGDCSLERLIANITEKIEKLQTSAECRD